MRTRGGKGVETAPLCDTRFIWDGDWREATAQRSLLPALLGCVPRRVLQFVSRNSGVQCYTGEKKKNMIMGQFGRRTEPAGRTTKKKLLPRSPSGRGGIGILDAPIFARFEKQNS